MVVPGLVQVDEDVWSTVSRLIVCAFADSCVPRGDRPRAGSAGRRSVFHGAAQHAARLVEFSAPSLRLTPVCWNRHSHRRRSAASAAACRFEEHGHVSADAEPSARRPSGRRPRRPCRGYRGARRYLVSLRRTPNVGGRHRQVEDERRGGRRAGSRSRRARRAGSPHGRRGCRRSTPKTSSRRRPSRQLAMPTAPRLPSVSYRGARRAGCTSSSRGLAERHGSRRSSARR